MRVLDKINTVNIVGSTEPFRVNHFNSRIGDGLLIEPALTAYALSHPKREVQLFANPEHHELFQDHPHITLVDEAHRHPDVVGDPSKAFDFAHRRSLPFAAGYFPQCGIFPNEGDRLHFKAFGPLFQELKKQTVNEVVIAPFSRSCCSNFGNPPNLSVPLDWWKPVIEACPLPVVSLGGKYDPKVAGTRNIRGLPLRQALLRLHRCRAFISVETGLLVMASAAKPPTVFLSSATPVFFSKPDTVCEVVRAASPLEWSQDEVIRALHRLLNPEVY